jgi:hypothetical protein
VVSCASGAYAPVVRVVASLRWQDALAERLEQSGWYVADRDFGRMAAIADFESLSEARAAAERDLPAGVPVNCSGGGFVVGYDGVAPEPGGSVPAYVLWPDGGQRLVHTREELAAALRERLDWLCERARELDLEGVETGRAAAARAIDAVAAGGELTNEARGPVFREGCTASVEPVARLRWDGFRHGWERLEGRPAEDRRPPCYQFDGAFADVWRDGFRAGEQAREHLTVAQRGALAPEPTEQELRERVIDDPEVRAWSREVNGQVRKELREFKRLYDASGTVAAHDALSALHERLLAFIRKAETDERPAAAKLAASLRRTAASTERLAAELAAGKGL